jgi:hypothetical protein
MLHFLCKLAALCAVGGLWDNMAAAVSIVSYVALACVTDRLPASLCVALWVFSTTLQRG